VLDAGLLRRGHGVQVLLGPLLAGAHAGDQQELLGALERGDQAVLVGVVAADDLDAAVGEVGELGRVAHDGADAGGGEAAVEQVLEDEAAEVSAGRGDDDHEGTPVVRCWRCRMCARPRHLPEDGTNF